VTPFARKECSRLSLPPDTGETVLDLAHDAKGRGTLDPAVFEDVAR
jgi:hypothetical protein